MAVNAGLPNLYGQPQGGPFIPGQPPQRQHANLQQNPAARTFHPQLSGRLVDTVVTTKENSLAPKTQRNEMLMNIATTVALIAAAAIVGITTSGIGIAVGLGVLAAFEAGRAVHNGINFSKKVQQEEVLTDAMRARVERDLGQLPEAGQQHQGFGIQMQPQVGQQAANPFA